MEPQFKIRQQQEEWQQGIADLKEWERSQKAKDSKATRGTGESQPARELAPIRYGKQRQAHILCVIRSPPHACGVHGRGSSYDNGATVIEEIVPEPVASNLPQGSKPQRLDKGKENHAAMHTYDHSKAKWDNFNPEEEALPRQPVSAAAPPKPSNTLADGFLTARETTRKPQQKPLPPVRQPPQADNSAEGHKNRGNELFRKTQYDQAVDAYTRYGRWLLFAVEQTSES